MTHSGTTSACAENTPTCVQLPKIERNYLRVRGEYQRLNDTNIDLRELPPRARRIHHYGDPLFMPEGTTSACAENTYRLLLEAITHRNYLRVRGEYSWLKYTATL